MTHVRLIRSGSAGGGDSISLVALPTSPWCLQSVSFGLARKPLLSMVIHVSSKQTLNKICGKDYLLARVDIHASYTCKMRWF